MRENFSPIPQGPFSVSRGYQERLQRAASRGSGGYSSLPTPGHVDDSSIFGQTYMPDPEFWVYVKITDQPGDASTDDDCPAYSGVEVRPDSCGSWVEVDNGLIFDNGSGTNPKNNPLYEANGAVDVPVDVVVKAYRGFLDTDTAVQEWVFWDIIGTSGTPVTPGDCPVWSCCSEVSEFGSVNCLDPDNPDQDLSSACPPAVFFSDATDAGCGGDPNCGFWSCDGGATPCPNDGDSWRCGCAGSDTAAGCYPFLITERDTGGNPVDGIDLQSTGIDIACLFGCEDGQLTARDACMAVIPGGPFGLRLGLLSKATGRELHTPTDSPY